MNQAGAGILRDEGNYNGRYNSITITGFVMHCLFIRTSYSQYTYIVMYSFDMHPYAMIVSKASKKISRLPGGHVRLRHGGRLWWCRFATPRRRPDLCFFHPDGM